MTLKQANLEAAQKSFLRVQGLSLFNYINSCRNQFDTLAKVPFAHQLARHGFQRSRLT